MAFVVENPTEFRENLRTKFNSFIKNKNKSILILKKQYLTILYASQNKGKS